MPVDRLQRRQEIIDIIKVLCNDTGRTDLLVGMEGKVKALTCDDRAGNGTSMLGKWDEANVDPFLVAGFIYANLDKDAAGIKGAQRTGNVGDAGNMNNDYTSNFASAGAGYKENARFMTILVYNNAAKGLNTHLNSFSYKTGRDIDWSKQLPLLKCFAVANSVFAADFQPIVGALGGAGFTADVVARDFYSNLKQLNTGDCSTVSSVRKTLLAAASLKAGFSKDETQRILNNVDDDIDNQYTEDRAQAFKALYNDMPHAGADQAKATIKKISVIFNSKKVSRDVVNGLTGVGNAGKRTAFKDAVVGINGDTPEGKNQSAFAAALAAAGANADTIKDDYLANADDTFRPENTKDFEYSLSRAQAFKELYTKFAPVNLADKQATIKKISVIFNSKKVDQNVVDELKGNDGKRGKFKDAVVGINGDTPEGKNQLAFAAALAAADANADTIKDDYLANADDTFRPENTKDFEYSLSRAQAFKELYTELTTRGITPKAAIKKASVIFDSKKVSQDVVNSLKDNAHGEITKFKDAVVGINGDTPEGRNQSAFAAALAAADVDGNIIKDDYLANADDTFKPENTEDFEYSLSRAQAFKALYNDMPHAGADQAKATIKKISVIFNSKKVSRDVVNGLTGVGNAGKRTAFKDAVVGINGDTPEGKNQSAFAAALAADGDTVATIQNTYLAHATDTFRPENAKDFEYTLERVQTFKELYTKFAPVNLADKQATIKKISVIFNSKKVDQNVVEQLKNSDVKRGKFRDALDGVDIDINAPADRNKLAFAAVLAAADVDGNIIKNDYLANADDTFRPENTKDFEYSLSRAQAFKELYTELTTRGITPKAAIKKASVIFDLKKVSQDVVNNLNANNAQKAVFKEVIAGIDETAPEGKNQSAFAAALAADGDTVATIQNTYLAHATDTFRPENAKDFEYTLERVQTFKELYTKFAPVNLADKQATIKKISVIFNSKKVDQNVVEQLKNSDVKRGKFRDALDGVDIDINAPADRNKLAFAAVLAAADVDGNIIKNDYLANAGDIFQSENAKDFEYSLSRAQAFKKLYDKLLEDLPAAPTNEQKQAAIKKASIIFDSKKVDQRVVNELNVPANNAQRTAFKNRVAAVNGDTPEDRNKLAFAADIAAQNFEKDLKELKVGDYNTIYSVRKTLVASALLKEGLTVEQSESVLKYLDNFFGSEDNKIALTPERLQAYASTMKAVIDEIGISDKKKLNQANEELLDLLRSNKIKDESVAYFNAFAPDQKKSIVLKGYLKDACEELDKSTTVDNYNDLVKNIGQRYEKQISAFKNRLSKQNDLDPSLKELVLSKDFLKIDDVAKNLSKGQIESLEKLDSASFRSIASLLNTVSKKESEGFHATIYNIDAEKLTGYINTLFGKGNEVTSDTISKNFSNAFSKASGDIDTKVLTGNFYDDGAAINAYNAVGVNTYINDVCSGCGLDADAKKDLRVFLQNMAHYDPSMLSGRNSGDTLVLFKELNGAPEIMDFLENYKQAVQNGVSQKTIANFYQEFHQINQNLTNKSAEFTEVNGMDISKRHNVLYALKNNLKSTIRDPLESFNEAFLNKITQQIKENKQADKALDESNAEEEAKEKQKIEDVRTIDSELKVRCTGNKDLEEAYKLHKTCLEDKDGQINDAYAVGLLAFTKSKDTTHDDTEIILGNIYDKIKDEEDKKDILSNIVSSGGLIVYKDILKNNEFDLSLLRKMAVDLSNDEKITKILDKEAQEFLKGTLCENKDGKVCLDKRDTTKEIGKEYEFTKTEWISYMAENGSKIKSTDYEFANMDEKQKDAFKKACLYLSPKLLEQEAVCAAISQNINKIKDDPEFFIHAINETYSKQNIKDKKATLETITDIVDRTEVRKGTILTKMTKEDFLELKGDAVWNVVKDSAYTTKMIDYAAGATPEKKENRRLYNSIVANSNDHAIFTNGGDVPAAPAAPLAAEQIGYNEDKFNDYLSNCEDASQRQTATKEIISAINNFEANFFKDPTTGAFYGKESYAAAIYNDISENKHLDITLKSRKVAPEYKEEVEKSFVWKKTDGNLLVDNDKLDSDTESILIQKLSRFDKKDRDSALKYLRDITNVYKDNLDTKSRDEFLKNVVKDLSKVKRPTVVNVQMAALRSVLAMKGISKEDQDLLFEKPGRAEFFIQHSDMFLDMDKEEFTQIFKKSPDPVKNDRAIDTIVEAAKSTGNTHLKKEFIVRSATYLSADSVINHFAESTRVLLNYNFKNRKYSDIYNNDRLEQDKRKLALEKARYMHLVWATHSFSRALPRGYQYGELNDSVIDIQSLAVMKKINEDLALLTNTTKTGKKNDKMLNTREDIYRFIKKRKKGPVLKPLDNFSNDDLTESINHFVYDGKDRESAEKFAKALIKYVKDKRDTEGAGYDRNAAERDLLTARTGFFANNQQYKAIYTAREAETNPLKKQKIGKQLEKLIDLARLYVKYDDNSVKLTHTLGNGMSLAAYDNLYDLVNDKIDTAAGKRRATILVTAGNSSTYALTGIYDIKSDVILQSLDGVNEDTYLKDNSKTYKDIADTINEKHGDAKTKTVQHIYRGALEQITHDELYKIEGLETFLAYTYSRARARALTDGMSPEEADFRAMAMTQAMDRKILTDDTFRAQVEEQIKEEEKQKINLLMLGYVEGKAGDIYGAAARKNAADMNIAIKDRVINNGIRYSTLYSIIHEVAPSEAKTVLDTTINELQDSVTSHLNIMGKNGRFINKTTFEKFISNKKKEAEESLSDTRSQLEKLCTSQIDTLERELYGSPEVDKSRAIITATSNDYKFNDECRTMVSNHASKLDNFSDEDLQNFGIACNALVLNSSALYGNATAANDKETALKAVGEKANVALTQGFAMSTLENVAHTIATTANNYWTEYERIDVSNSIKDLANYTKEARQTNFSSDVITDVVSAIVNAKEYDEAFEWYKPWKRSKKASNRIDKFADTTAILIADGGDVDKIKDLATAIKNAKDNGVKKKGLLQDKDVQNAISGIGGRDIKKRDAFVNAITDVYDLCKGNTIENIVHTISNTYTANYVVPPPAVGRAAARRAAVAASRAAVAASRAAQAIKNISACAFNANTSKYSADTTIDVASTVCHAYDTAAADPAAAANPAAAGAVGADTAAAAMSNFAKKVKESADKTGDWTNFFKQIYKDEEKLNRGINEHHIISIVNSSAIKPSFEKIESPQTLAKVSKLIADEVKKGKNTSIVGDTETQTKLLLLLAADSKPDALNELANDGSIKDESALSSLCSEGFKELNKEQKTSLLKKINTDKLDDFTQNLIDQGMVKSLELYDILKNDDDLKKHTNKTLNKIESLGDVRVIYYKDLEDYSRAEQVKEAVVTKIQYDKNEGVEEVDKILYKKAGEKFAETVKVGKNFGKEFAKTINEYSETDTEENKESNKIAKQKLAYAFVFANEHKEGAPGSESLAQPYKDLLGDLETDNKKYLFRALLEKQCGNPYKDNDISAEQFAENVLAIDKLLTEDEDKEIFVKTVKRHVRKMSSKSQKVADIFTALCNSEDTNAAHYVGALLEEQIELSKNNSHVKHMPKTEEIISQAMKKISVGTDTPENIEKTTKNFYNLVKNISSENNREDVMNGIMSYIESLDKMDEQAKVSVSLAKMFTKNIKTEEDRKLGDQLLTSMARNFAGNEELFIEIMNKLDKNKQLEGDLQAELFCKYSKYADHNSVQHVYNNSNVKNNNVLHTQYDKTDNGSYSKKDNRDIDDILAGIGIKNKKDQEIIIEQLKRCSNTAAVTKILNDFIDAYNSNAEIRGPDKINNINSQDIIKIEKKLMLKRKDLLNKLISGDAKIFEGGSVMLDSVEKYAKGMNYRELGEKNELKGQLLSAVSKMREREKTFREKADTITKCKEFNARRAMTAAEFISKMNLANSIISKYETEGESGSITEYEYQAAKQKRKELLSQKYDFSQTGRHWYNKGMTRRFGKSAKKNWFYFVQGVSYAVALAAKLIVNCALDVIALAAVGGLIWGAVALFALGGGLAIAGGIAVAAVALAAAAGATYGLVKYHTSKGVAEANNHINNWPGYWRDKALKIKEEKLMEKAAVTLEKSNHALTVLTGEVYEVNNNLRNLSADPRDTFKRLKHDPIGESDMTLTTKRLRGIRGGRFAGIHPFTGEDGIEHKFMKGTIRRTTEMNASESFADMKLKKYNEDMTAIMKAFTKVRAAGLGEKSELPPLPIPEKKNDMVVPINKANTAQMAR